MYVLQNTIENEQHETTKTRGEHMYQVFRKIIIAYFPLYISSLLYLFTLSMLFNFSFTLNFNTKYKATVILFKQSSSFFHYRIIELYFFSLIVVVIITSGIKYSISCIKMSDFVLKL